MLLTLLFVIMIAWKHWLKVACMSFQKRSLFVKTILLVAVNGTMAVVVVVAVSVTGTTVVVVVAAVSVTGTTVVVETDPIMFWFLTVIFCAKYPFQPKKL
jgi:hypothetical protein